MRTRVRWQLVDDEIDSKAKPTTWRRYRRGKTPTRIHHEDSPRARASSSRSGCSRCWKKINIASLSPTISPILFAFPPIHHRRFFLLPFRPDIFFFSSPFCFFLILFYSLSLSLLPSLPPSSSLSLVFLRFCSTFSRVFFFLLIRLTIITVETKRTTNASRILLVFLLQRSVAFNQMTQRTGMIAFNGD